MTSAYFITGTDTEVGKTFASVALIQALVNKGYKVAGYKPVAAGNEETTEGLCNPDAVALKAASNVAMTYQEANPCLLDTPCSPHIAADIEGRDVSLAALSDGLHTLAERSDIVIVEGAGGWQVPVSGEASLSEWVKAEQLPVIMVVGMKLGCLNHALLTAQAIRHDGLVIKGWIANCVDPNAQYLDEMIETLNKRLDTPCLGVLPFTEKTGADLSGCLTIPE